jgi:hypothetical protein
MGVTIIPRSVVLLLGAGNRFNRRGILYPGTAWLMMQIIISPIRGDDLVDPVGKWLDSLGIE